MDEVLAEAGLDGITLPGEKDTMKVIRYEATIMRTMNRAIARLEAAQKQRELKAKEGSSEPGAKEPQSKPTEPRKSVVDPGAKTRLSKRIAHLLPPMAAIRIKTAAMDFHMKEAQAKEDAELAAKRADEKAAGIPSALFETENDQTKPNDPAKPKGVTQSTFEIFAKAVNLALKLNPEPE
jgi:hypothetical protein